MEPDANRRLRSEEVQLMATILRLMNDHVTITFDREELEPIVDVLARADAGEGATTAASRLVDTFRMIVAAWNTEPVEVGRPT